MRLLKTTLRICVCICASALRKKIKMKNQDKLVSGNFPGPWAILPVPRASAFPSLPLPRGVSPTLRGAWGRGLGVLPPGLTEVWTGASPAS